MMSLLPLSFTCILIRLTLCKVVFSKTAVIIGGGPAGMATGLMLQQRGWSTTIIEKRPEFVSEDESKSYSYFLDGRGRKMTDMLNISHQIAAHAITNHQFKTVSMFLPNGERKPIQLPPNPSIGQIDKYWIPRPKFMHILQNCITESNTKLQSAKESTLNGNVPKIPIQMIFGAECTHFSYSQSHSNAKHDEDDISSDSLPSSSKLIVHATVYDKESDTYKYITTNEADIVIACDGINSAIRSCLLNLTSSSSSSSSLSSFATSHRKDIDTASFELSSFPSPAAGLLYKMLPITNDEYLQLPPEEGMSIRSVGKSKRSFLSLGMLPTKKGLTRSFNFICRSDHDLWRVRTVEELTHYLNTSFPQLYPLERFVTQESLRSFLNRAPGMFPRPQHVNTLAALVTPTVVTHHQDNVKDTTHSTTVSKRNTGYTLTRSGTSGSMSGVVLLGDAAHAFPPDTGQGINSALEDVFVFKQSLDACQDNITRALPLYHKSRINDIHSLCELVSFSYPYQYNQDLTMKQFYMLNFALRMGLNIINKMIRNSVETIMKWMRFPTAVMSVLQVPILFHPPAIQVVGNENLAYSEVLRRVTVSTVLIESIFLSGLLYLGLKNLFQYDKMIHTISGGAYINTGKLLVKLKRFHLDYLKHTTSIKIISPLILSLMSFLSFFIYFIYSTILKKLLLRW